jgi:hypothetical protein
MNADDVRAAAAALARIEEIDRARSRLAAADMKPDPLPWTDLAARLRLPRTISQRLGAIFRDAIDVALLAEREAAERALRDLDVEPPPNPRMPERTAAWEDRGEEVGA